MRDALIERRYRAHFTEGRSLFDRDSFVQLVADGEHRGDALS